MSRLEKHYKKQVVFYSILIIIVIILLSTAGLQIVLNSTSYLSQFFGKKSDTGRRNPLLQNIDLNNIPSATNSATIKISGNANNFSELDVYLNDNQVKKISLAESGDFSEEVGELQKGENKLFLVAKSTKESKKTDVYTVIYRADKPKLDIKEPSDGSKTSKNEIKVSGNTDKDIDIKINGLPIVVDSTGNFQAIVKLNEGDNKIKVTALDLAGNTEEKTIAVKYEKD